MKTLHDIARNSLSFLLRPIVRYAIKHTISLRDFYELSKVLYVQEAKRHLAENGSKVIIMRVSAVTGIRRVDVAKLFDAKEEEVPSYSIIGEIIRCWQQKYSDSGKPRSLDHKGASSEFHVLVKSVSLRHSPKSILTHLEGAGMIEFSDGKVVLLTQDLERSEGQREKFAALGNDISELIDCAQASLESDHSSNRLFKASTVSSIEKIQEESIKTWLQERKEVLHREYKEFLESLPRSEDNKKSDHLEVRLTSLATMRPED